MATRTALHSVRTLGRKAKPALRAAAMGATLLVAGTSGLQNAVANGDTRTLTLHHTHSGESGSFTFKKNGRYDSEVLGQLNHFLRDWRNQKSTQMDPQLFDIVWEVYRETDATAPVQIVSSYRSPETNSMLRSRSRGVAKFSQHMLGKAMDFYIPGVNLTDLRVAGLRLQRGGVGFYPTSGSPFVHMDTGNVRHWPRMTHDQLARVFPDGKTVHVPTDGRPLANYNAAVAELQARGNKPGVAMASADGKGVKNFFSGLFGKKDADDDEGGEVPVQVAAQGAGQGAEDAGTPAAAGPATRGRAGSAPVQTAAAMPVPPARPAEIAAGAIVTAQATSGGFAPLPLRRPIEADAGRNTRTASLTAAPGVPLPAVITRGTDAESGAAALGYASPGPLADQRGTLSGGMMPHAATPAVAAAPAGRQRARLSEVTFGRLFLSPSLSTELYLRTPELRHFGAFMAPPHEVVASAFSRDGSFGLRARFVGTAVADVPTYVFRAPAIAYSQRM